MNPFRTLTGRTRTDTDQVQPSSMPMLTALNHSGKHIYAGTVPEHTIRARRAANKRARQSRRINRGK